ncbi:hypothetical protein BJ170DRAFT_720950 [Xylariales sp. AK1849]|nr:hypothetical protein BJ170DRAFT_720950 [Xylariales sp. AK1849]
MSKSDTLSSQTPSACSRLSETFLRSIANRFFNVTTDATTPNTISRIAVITRELVIQSIQTSFVRRQMSYGDKAKASKSIVINTRDLCLAAYLRYSNKPQRGVLIRERKSGLRFDAGYTIDQADDDGTFSSTLNAFEKLLDQETQPEYIMLLDRLDVIILVDKAQVNIAMRRDPGPAEFAEGLRQHISSISCNQLNGLIKDLRCLTRFIDEYTVLARERLAGKTGPVRFSDLWYVFPADSLTYVKGKAIPQKIWRVVQRSGGRRYLSQLADAAVGDYTRKLTAFTLGCYHLDYDGNHYVPVYQQFEINRIEGSQQLASLTVYPLHLAEEENNINRARLLARANLLIEFTKISHRYYDGRSLSRSPKEDRLIDMVEGAVHNYPNVSWHPERIISEVMV